MSPRSSSSRRDPGPRLEPTLGPRPTRAPATGSSGQKSRSRAAGQPRPRRSGGDSRGGLPWWSLARALLSLAIWGLIAALGVVAYFAYDLPPVERLMAVSRAPSVTVTAADGSVIATYGEAAAEQVPVEAMPPWLPGAVLAIEDRKFHSHFGIDPLGIARAALANLRAGRLVQGGSTITQQAAKNLFLTQERTLKRKVQEMLIAFWLEARYSKAQILTLYLNRVYFGAGTYGVEAAARRYFGVSARQVSPYQAAVLAGLLKAPSRYNPQSDPQAAAARAAVVLRAMAETGVLSADQAAQAAAVGPGSLDAAAAAARGRLGRAYADWIMEAVDEYVGSTGGDLVVRTTYDPRLQAAAEDALTAILAEDGPARGVSQGAVVVMTPDGAVRAMVGGRDYLSGGFNRATQARRQPGSAFKPFLYLAAVEAGMRPDDTVLDAPISIGGWAPENFDQKFRGAITLREAVARSINTVAVRVMQRVGVPAVIATARRMGVAGDLQPNLSLALGTGETTLLALTGAYAPFANGGQGVIPYGITAIETADGTPLYFRQGEGLGEIATPWAIGVMNDLLAGVVERGTGTGARIGRPQAGKTGTSGDYRDAWFMGYTADYVAGVWVGNDDNAPMKKVTGGATPAKIWRTAMAAAHQGLPARPLPSAPLPAPPAAEDATADALTRLFESVFGAPAGSVSPAAPAAPAATFGGIPVRPHTAEDIEAMNQRN